MYPRAWAIAETMWDTGEAQKDFNSFEPPGRTALHETMPQALTMPPAQRDLVILPMTEGKPRPLTGELDDGLSIIPRYSCSRQIRHTLREAGRIEPGGVYSGKISQWQAIGRLITPEPGKR